MEFFTHRTEIDFMAQKKWAFIFSLAILIFSIGSIIIRGLNLGLDFTGGVQLELSYESPPDFDRIRESIKNIGYDPIVQAYGSSKDVMIKLKLDREISQEQLTNKVSDALDGAQLRRS